MARVKNGVITHKRHKKFLKQTKGFFLAKRNVYSVAKPALDHALASAYIGRKNKKRDYRKLWIARISAATRAQGMSYSNFMHGLKLANIDINRKMLSELAIYDAAAFTKLVETAKAALK